MNEDALEKLAPPYLDGELEFVVPANALGKHLAHAIGESPFAYLVDLREGEPGRPTEEMGTGEELDSFEADILDEIEQHQVDDEAFEDDQRNPEWGEPKQLPDSAEASDEDEGEGEAHAFVDETEQLTSGGDLVAANEASPFDNEEERDSIDFDAGSEVEDESADEAYTPQWKHDTEVQLRKPAVSVVAAAHGCHKRQGCPVVPLQDESRHLHRTRGIQDCRRTPDHRANSTKEYPYPRADAANKAFADTFEEFLMEVWIGNINFTTMSGPRPTDDQKIAELAEKCMIWVTTRGLNGNLSRESFSSLP